MATTTSMIGPFAARLAAVAALLLAGLPALAQSYVETPLFAERVGKGELPPVAQRLPRSRWSSTSPPRAAASAGPAAKSTSLVARGRDIRYMSVQSYARLVGYTEKLALEPDLLAKLENDNDQIFTFRLRDGHRWSDGHPFTTDDFRYYWEDVAHNPELSPAGLPEFMIAGRQAAPLRDPRRAHGPLQLGQAEPALPAAARRAARPVPVPAGPLPEAVPHEIRRQGKARGSREEAEAQVLGGAAQPHGRHVREHQSGPADPAGLAGDECRPGDPLHLRAQPLLPPGRRDRSAAALYRPRDLRRRGRRPHGREGERRRDRPPVPRALDERHPDPQGGRARQGLQDPALALRPRQRARALPQPQHRRPGVADAEPRRALPPRPVARHRSQDAEQRASLRARPGRQQHDPGGERAVLAGAAQQIRPVRPGGSVPAPRRDRADEAQRRRHPASPGRPRARDHRRDRRRGRLHRRRADADHRVLARDRHQALRQAAGPHHPAQPRLCRA